MLDLQSSKQALWLMCKIVFYRSTKLAKSKNKKKKEKTQTISSVQISRWNSLCCMHDMHLSVTVSYSITLFLATVIKKRSSLILYSVPELQPCGTSSFEFKYIICFRFDWCHEINSKTPVISTRIQECFPTKQAHLCAGCCDHACDCINSTLPLKQSHVKRVQCHWQSFLQTLPFSTVCLSVVCFSAMLTVAPRTQKLSQPLACSVTLLRSRQKMRRRSWWSLKMEKRRRWLWTHPSKTWWPWRQRCSLGFRPAWFCRGWVASTGMGKPCPWMARLCCRTHAWAKWHIWWTRTSWGWVPRWCLPHCKRCMRSPPLMSTSSSLWSRRWGDFFPSCEHAYDIIVYSCVDFSWFMHIIKYSFIWHIFIPMPLCLLDLLSSVLQKRDPPTLTSIFMSDHNIFCLLRHLGLTKAVT